MLLFSVKVIINLEVFYGIIFLKDLLVLVGGGLIKKNFIYFGKVEVCFFGIDVYFRFDFVFFIFDVYLVYGFIECFIFCFGIFY